MGLKNELKLILSTLIVSSLPAQSLPCLYSCTFEVPPMHALAIPGIQYPMKGQEMGGGFFYLVCRLRLNIRNNKAATLFLVHKIITTLQN